MTQHRLVTFLRPMPPNGPGDVAGLPPALAERLVGSKHAQYADEDRLSEAKIDLSVMTRAELVDYGRIILGFEDEPPAEVTDDEIRTAIQAHLDGMPVPPASAAPVTLDQLDALDRQHLEAFATTKAGFAQVDPTLSDDDLRAQIRASIDASVSHVGPTGKKGGKAR